MTSAECSEGALRCRDGPTRPLLQAGRGPAPALPSRPRPLRPRAGPASPRARGRRRGFDFSRLPMFQAHPLPTRGRGGRWGVGGRSGRFGGGWWTFLWPVRKGPEEKPEGLVPLAGGARRGCLAPRVKRRQPSSFIQAPRGGVAWPRRTAAEVLAPIPPRPLAPRARSVTGGAGSPPPPTRAAGPARSRPARR